MEQTKYMTTEANLVPHVAEKDFKVDEISIQIEEEKHGYAAAKAGLGILTKSESRGTKPFYLCFENLFYQIKVGPNQNKKIINNISGYFKSGEITAIMGPSGCGKTSLLNYLTNRVQFPKHSVHSGNIFINSEEINTNKVADYSSYVMQDDVMFDVFTPIETLKFISMLKDKKSEEQYTKEVDELIEILKLEKCRNTRIGNPQRKGLSGGEKKRVSIGCEIMSKPSILFLDEPTSGLDSTTSGVIIQFLKELAKVKNMIVAFTIHQPSSNIFQHFDRLFIVNKGELVYQGPAQKLDSKQNVIGGIVPYFDNSLKIPLKVKANPCDAFMHIIEEQNAGFEGTHIIENPDLKDKEPLTKLYKDYQYEDIKKEMYDIKTSGDKCTIPQKTAHHVSFCSEFATMLKRSWLYYIRNPLTLQIKCIMTCVYIFISLSIFWKLKTDYQGTYDRAGFFFFFSVNNFLSIVFGAILVFPQERGIFLREYASKLYGVSTYYISKNIIETPLVLINTMIFGLAIYHGTGLRDDDVKHYFIFVFSYIVLGWLAHSLGYFFGSTFSDLNTATIITQFTVVPFFLFSGFLINVANMADWLMWLQYFSPFRFAGEAGIRNEFNNNPIAHHNVGDEYNMNIGMWNCVLIMFAWGCFLRILGGICLKLLVKKVG